MKKKRKAKKGQESWLENLLRFEIVVLLFGLIGFYYFLSFSPIRMPKEPIVSPQVSLAPLPPLPEPVVLEEEVQVDSNSAESSALSVEVVGQVISEPALESKLSENAVVHSEPVGEVNSDDTLPVVVEVQKNVPTKDLISNEGSISRKELTSNEEPESQSVEPVAPVSLPPVESAQSDSLASAEPISVSAQTLPASTPVGPPVSVPVSPVAPAPASSPTVQMVVEVGSYVLQSDLHKFRTQLEELGFVVKTETVKRLTPMFRVFLGPYPDRQKSRSMMAEARKLGDQPFLQKRGSGYVVVIGCFYLESSVIAWENMYHDAGLDPQVQKVNLMIPHTLLQLDGIQVNRDPQAVLARIQALGFPEARLVRSEK
ncbi:MAG: SPOR domain-containing protein [Pseudomonadota bacterium]|nr:SPOR domain-containing protein [Pseudomonadota bacterium]